MQERDKRNTHFWISLIKSGFRFVAAGFLVMGNFVVAGLMLALAEVLGILEEL
jgi:hypothetical protein